MGLSEEQGDGSAGGVAEDMNWREIKGGDESCKVAGVEVPVIMFFWGDGRVGPGEAAGVVDDVEVRGEEGLDVGEASKIRDVSMREDKSLCVGGAGARLEVVESGAVDLDLLVCVWRHRGPAVRSHYVSVI